MGSQERSRGRIFKGDTADQAFGQNIHLQSHVSSSCRKIQKASQRQRMALWKGQWTWKRELYSKARAGWPQTSYL